MHRATPDPDHLAAAESTPELAVLARRLQAQLDGYLIEAPLGRGGMGAVFRAHHLKLDRPVAVKVLLPEPGTVQGWQERFLREARALARLQHPGIVGVYDYGQSAELAWIVMEYVDGASLRQLLEDGKLPPEDALGIVPQICSALQYAHDHGVVHRDVKPENVLLDEAGRVKIADFGLAKLMDGSAAAQLTGSAQAMGTLRYMAPEQIERPREVDHRADIFSLGVVFYEMLTGHVPAGVVDPPSRKVGVDARLDEVVLRSMEREPDMRFQRVDEMRGRVEELQHPAASGAAPAPAPSVSSPVRTRLRAASAVLALLSIAWIFGPWDEFWVYGFQSAMGLLYGATVLGLFVTVLVLGETGRGQPAAICQMVLSGAAIGWCAVYQANEARGDLQALPAAAAGSAGLIFILGVLQVVLREASEPSLGEDLSRLNRWIEGRKDEE